VGEDANAPFKIRGLESADAAEKHPKTPPQPVVNPKHTHIQVMFTSGSAIFFPVNVDDATKAIEAWKNGIPVLTLRPADGSAFHVNVGAVLFCRQVDAATAQSMLDEQNARNAAQAEAAEAARTRANLAGSGALLPR
jgi:hypothetical protein